MGQRPLSLWPAMLEAKACGCVLCGISYDLVFWKQTAAEARPAAEIYADLAEGRDVAGLVGLPIEIMLADVLAAFPDAVREPSGLSDWIRYEPPDAEYSFQVEWSARYLLASLRGKWPHTVANTLVDICGRYHAQLYDPQAGERFP